MSERDNPQGSARARCSTHHPAPLFSCRAVARQRMEVVELRPQDSVLDLVEHLALEMDVTNLLHAAVHVHPLQSERRAGRPP